MREYKVPSVQASMRYNDLPGEKTPIVFIHGLGCAGSYDYTEVVAQEGLRQHRRIIVDLLGAGYSDRPTQFDYTVEAHAAYLATFIDSLQLESFILFGHSLGGAIALTMTTQCKTPIKQLILSEANLDPSPLQSASRQIAEMQLKEFTSTFPVFVQQVRDSGNTMWAASLSLWLPKAVHALSSSALKGGTPTWRNVLYDLQCPRVFIFGEKSLPDSDEQELATHGIQIEVISHAGHSMAWENPIGLSNIIAKYGAHQ